MDKNPVPSSKFSLELHFSIEQEDDGFVATCTDLDIASQGETVEQALSRCKEAIELYFQVLAEDGELHDLLRARGIVPEYSDSGESPQPEHFSTTSRVLVGVG